MQLGYVSVASDSGQYMIKPEFVKIIRFASRANGAGEGEDGPDDNIPADHEGVVTTSGRGGVRGELQRGVNWVLEISVRHADTQSRDPAIDDVSAADGVERRPPRAVFRGPPAPQRDDHRSPQCRGAARDGSKKSPARRRNRALGDSIPWTCGNFWSREGWDRSWLKGLSFSA